MPIMSITEIPAMLFSEKAGWTRVDRSHLSHRWFLKSLVLPMSLLPPLLFAYGELVHPGAVFPLSQPPLTPTQLLTIGLVLYLTQIAMVSFMTMVIQSLARARDHDPGYDGAYALASIAAVPLWLSSLALLVPNRGFNLAVAAAALVASIALIRHGVRPLLHIQDEKTARYVADVVTMVGVAAWIGALAVAEGLLSLLLG
jgi:hypothetical protein